MYIPTTMLFVTPFVGLNIGCYGNITTATVHLYPGIDPVVLIFIIRDFRQTILRPFRCFYRSNSVENTATIRQYQQSSSKG
ncbi:Seven TM Receptor [Caenorhabditis elegans]|nr:Seven TM Receptor [Caenorhabditis elegans]SAP35605.1 Seven TM Receptor [Caenorhabditis elegans]|eukprot:NP_001317843.1 Seven TM Receptor [Caenorhabditis elegans]